MKLFVHRFRGWVSPADCFAAFYARSDKAFWLDRQTHQSERFSIIGEGDTTVEFVHSGSDFSVISQTLEALKTSLTDDELPELPFSWRPGVVAAISYDGRQTSHLLSVTKAMIFDHDRREMWFVGLASSKKSFEWWLHSALLGLTLTGGNALGYRFEKRMTRNVGEISARHSDSQYLELIAEAKSQIAAGNVYQLCLTNQLSAKHDLDPLDVFYRLRLINPAPYAGFMKHGDFSLASTSIEQFLTVSSSGRLQTKPIKGTRAATGQSDDSVKAELASDHKERAENLMIVDLMRNDLAKVSEPDSVQVAQLFAVETYATVHQLVSTVESQLSDGKTAVDALEAVFPGGSMTGAPKTRAIELIEAFEKGPRGIYSGAFGYFGIDGSADLAMVIRSIVFNGDELSIGIGGGITSDSEPAFELAETKLKARALLAALEMPDAW